jgi:hypothetical protein
MEGQKRFDLVKDDRSLHGVTFLRPERAPPGE